MLYRNASILAFACMLAATGCRDNGTLTPADLSMAGGGAGGTDMAGGGAGGDMVMKTYTMSTVTAMRTAGAFGNFEIDNVPVTAVAPTGKKMYVQDVAGGASSAIEVACPSSGTHMCSMQTTVKTVAIGHQVTIKGTYEKGGATTGGFETFYLDTITDNGAAPAMPPVMTLTLADIIKTNGTANSMASRPNWFARVKVTLTDALVMFDMSPAEFAYSGGTNGCPGMFGWGMVPMTGAPTGPAACDATCNAKPAPATCTQPAAQAAADANEVLIGTDFYSGFKYSSDCKCYNGFGDTVVAPTNKVASAATIQGILIYNSPPMKTGYLYLAPTTSPPATSPDFTLQ